MSLCLALSVVGDDAGSSLQETILFCQSEGVRLIDIRTIGGREAFSMPLWEATEVASAIENAGLRVQTLHPPLLNVPAGGPDTRVPQGDPKRDPLVYAFDLAIVLGAERIRVGSYQSLGDYRPADLFGKYERLVDLGSQYDVTAVVENEIGGNISSVRHQSEFFSAMARAIDPAEIPPRLKAMLNLADSRAVDCALTGDDLKVLAPHIEGVRAMDWSTASSKYVAVGDGDVPWRGDLARIIAAIAAVEEPPEQLSISVEARGQLDRARSLVRSIEAVRRLAAEFGLKVL
jgi:hypothetical protein